MIKDEEIKRVISLYQLGNIKINFKDGTYRYFDSGGYEIHSALISIRTYTEFDEEEIKNYIKNLEEPIEKPVFGRTKGEIPKRKRYQKDTFWRKKNGAQLITGLYLDNGKPVVTHPDIDKNLIARHFKKKLKKEKLSMKFIAVVIPDAAARNILKMLLDNLGLAGWRQVYEWYLAAVPEKERFPEVKQYDLFD